LIDLGQTKANVDAINPMNEPCSGNQQLPILGGYRWCQLCSTGGHGFNVQPPGSERCKELAAMLSGDSPERRAALLTTARHQGWSRDSEPQ
jgi:hypothetical protein